jgi:hypothetical protein
VRTDDAPVYRATLNPGDEKGFEARTEIVFTVGDAAAVAVTINGAQGRPLGGPGRVVTTRVSPANFRSLLVRN